MSKIINYNNEFHNKILSGIEKAEKCVCSTLGPSGRPVLINEGRQTRLTKDGITVFNSIELDDPVENSAVQALREASAKVAKEAGDGTTTVTSLGAAIYKNGLKYTTMNANPVQIKSGIDKAASKAIEIITSDAKSISSKEDIEKICMISSNGDKKVSEVIAEVFSKLGADATIKIEDSGSEIGYDIVDGFQLPNTGYLSPFFCTSDDMTCNFSKAHVLIVDGRITNINEILRILQDINQTHQSLLIIADSIETEVLSQLVMNRLKAGLQVCCVRAPSYGENRKAIYRDIAMLTNAKVVSEETGISLIDTSLQSGVLGHAKSVTATKDNCIIVGSGDNKEELDAYIQGLKKQKDSCNNEFDLKKIEERYARLTNGIGKINIFAPTQLELKELKDRVDDAFCAAKSALKGGVVSGGGTSLLRAKRGVEEWLNTQSMTDDEKIGAKILINSLEAPIRSILENAGMSSDLIVSKIIESNINENIGYDVVSKQYVNMIEKGIIDPCQVECSAIQNAASIAGTLLTSSSCIVLKPEENKNVPPMMPMM